MSSDIFLCLKGEIIDITVSYLILRNRQRSYVSLMCRKKKNYPPLDFGGFFR